MDGERGMFSYSKKIKILNNLQIAEQDYLSKIKNLEFKNSLLTSYKGAREIDLDYVEILIRSKFFLKKKNETIYIINNDN